MYLYLEIHGVEITNIFNFGLNNTVLMRTKFGREKLAELFTDGGENSDPQGMRKENIPRKEHRK